MPTIITANSRLSRILRQIHDREQMAQGLNVWTSPEILPMGAWLQASWRSWIYAAGTPPVQLLSSAQELAIWDDIIGRSEVADQLLHVGPTARAAMDAFQLLHDWDVPLDAPEWENSQDTEAFRQWAKKFIAVCERENWLSGACLVEFVTEKISSGEIPVPEEVRFAGFMEFTRAQEALLSSLKSAGARIEIQRNFSRQPDSAVRVGFVDSAQEIRIAARWARQLLDSHLHSGSDEPTIGIVVPELSLNRSAIERLFAEELHPGWRTDPEKDVARAFNISLGPALSEYPLVQAALLILRLNPGIPMSFDDVTRLLRCPFIAGGTVEIHSRAAHDIHLRDLKEPELRLSEVLKNAPAGLLAALTRWQSEVATHPARQVPSSWAAHFSSLLKSIGWPGDRTLRSTEFQTTTAWNEVVAEFATLDTVTGVVSRSVALARLQRMVSERQFQAESNPAPIQILGAFEASGLTFDHLWILGMHDGAWPRPANSNPFLPLRLQRIANVPHSSPQRELSFTRLLSEQLVASSPDVVVSCPLKESDSVLRLSPMFSQLRAISIDDLNLPARCDHAEMLFHSSQLESLHDHSGPLWIGTRIKGGTRMFKFQAACPFQSFSKLRLGTEPLESPSIGLSAADRGSLVHDVLRGVWTEFGSHQTLADASPSFVHAVIHDEVQAAISSLANRKAVLRNTRFAAIEQFRLERLIREWLDLERAREPFTVVAVEQQKEIRFAGIDFQIRTDRVDQLTDGSHILIDYKTSALSSTAWEGPRPGEPQLPLYAVTAEYPWSAVVFGVVRTGTAGFTGLSAQGGTLPGVRAGDGEKSLASQLKVWPTVLEDLAAQFRSGNAAVDPKEPRACSYCRLHTLCRISESDLSDIEGEDGLND